MKFLRHRQKGAIRRFGPKRSQKGVALKGVRERGARWRRRYEKRPRRGVLAVLGGNGGIGEIHATLRSLWKFDIRQESEQG